MEHTDQLRILMIEDNPGDYFLVGEYLKEGPWQLSMTHARRLSEGLNLAHNQSFDLILLDLTLPDSTGMEGVRQLLPFVNHIPLVVLTGMEDERYGVESLQMGVQDYLVKDQINAPLLIKTIRYSIERLRVRKVMSKQDRLFRVLTENSQIAKTLIQPDGNIVFGTSAARVILGLQGADPAERNLVEFIHPSDVPALQIAIDQTLGNPDLQPSLEIRITYADGSFCWCEMGLANLLHDEMVGALVCTFWDITERRRANELIAISERRLSALIQSGSDLIWVIDTRGHFQYVSPNCKKVLGFQPEFLLGKNYLDFVFEEDMAVLRDAFQQLTDKQEHTARPFRFRNAKGQWRWIETEMVNLLLDEAVNGIVFNSRDITEKIKSQHELQRLSLIVEETPNVVIVTDARGQITWVNRGFTNTTGYELSEVLGKSPGKILQGPDTDPSVVARMRHAIQNCQPFEAEVLNHTKSGEPYWISVHSQPLFNKEGELEQYFAIMTDITERRNQQALLRASEERYRNLFEGSPAAILLWEPESGRILQVNETAVQEYGYGRDEFVKLELSDIIADRQVYLELMQVAQDLKSGQRARRLGISRSIRRNGQIIAMERTAHHFAVDHQPVILMVEQNVTEKVELEAALETERLARQQLVTDAVISAQENERREIGIELHDNINQILASARLYLGLVQSTTPEPSPLIAETDNLINSAIDEIRTLSHALIPPSLNESALFDALDHIIAVTRRTSDLQIKRSWKDIDESSLPEKLKLTIYRIVQEQINNILKHAKASQVLISLEKGEDCLELRINDDGVGFDIAQKPKGVGFMNMKTRASLFNGGVQVLSAPGLGCELVVKLSCKQ